MKKYEFFLKSIVNKSVLLLGYGISNQAIYKFIYKHCKNITIYNKIKINCDNFIVKTDIKDLINQKYDYIFRSPSILPNNDIIKFLINNTKHKSIILTEIELFMNLCDYDIIGVTGSDGKTTTSTLIYEILKYNNYYCWLGGNIGVPLINEIKKFKKNSIIVLELSSFQLMNISISPHISVITNITENHLDVHSSMAEYINAKFCIFKNQNFLKDKIIINTKLLNLISKFININNENLFKFDCKNKINKNYLSVDKYNNIIFYDKNFNQIKLFNIKNIKIRGIHNIENILAASLATYKYCKFNNIDKVLMNFNGVKHRIEYVKTINNISFYNDSVATTPNRTIAALKSFKEKLILIIGGYDKNLSYKCLIPYFLKKVKILILMGNTGIKIQTELSKIKHSIKIYNATQLKESIKIAYDIANIEKINTVLFSPASASYDQFKNFEERGNIFKSIINSL